jgi:CheY-like chemotaxis protein
MGPDMDDQDDLFLEEDESAVAITPAKPWRVLVVDDDASVHQATALVLGRFRFRDRGIELHHAYSGAEGLKKVAEVSDLAMVLLDVVMETDDAGLRVAHAIRNTLHNQAIRIVLRTGQPGQSPAERVIVEYDINDYKEKTELTASRLFTTVVAALRGYADIMAIETSRRGLRKIIASSDRLLEETSLHEFAAGVLTQIGALLEVPASGIVCVQRRRTADGNHTRLLLGTGNYESLSGGELDESFPHPQIRESLLAALEQRSSLFYPQGTTLYIAAKDGHEVAAWVATERTLSQTDRELLEVFAAKLPISFSNIVLYESMRSRAEALVDIVSDLEQRLATR